MSSHRPDISRIIAVFMRFLRSVRGTTAGENKKNKGKIREDGNRLGKKVTQKGM
jgi:hypothetical protein